MVGLTAELAQCPVAADKVIDGKVSDPTSGATHNQATTIAGSAEVDEPTLR